MSDHTPPRQLVVFTLAGEQYALPIRQVHEIIRYKQPRSVASTEHSVRGVISLRGQIVPVYDLAARLDVSSEPDEQSKIMIVGSGSHAAGAADVVQRIADLLRPIADTVDVGGSGLGDLATAIDSLADHARISAHTIDRCLALVSGCPDRGMGGLLASRQCDLAAQWTVMLEATLDAAAAIYRCACSELADRVALAEEHLRYPQSRRLTASVCPQPSSPGTHARSLRAPRAGSSF